MLIRHIEPHGPLRSKVYPEVGDQLDAIFKMACALKEQGISLPADTLAWIDQCQAVKETYPKKE